MKITTPFIFTFALMVATPLLVGCDAQVTDCNGGSYCLTKEKQLEQIDINEQSYYASLREALAQQKNALQQKDYELKIAKIDAQISSIKSKAAAEENTLIQDSIKDKDILKKWHPATNSSSFEDSTPTSSNAIHYYSTSGNSTASYWCVNNICQTP